MPLSSSKRVYVAYTGGTIGMAHTPQGYAPQRGYLAQQMAALTEFQHPEIPATTLHEYDTLLDSANINPAHWLQIAEDIAAHYADYDGFVVLHGTDTMAYTASALAFILENLNKPVILTGSQIPLAALRSDGRRNLINALLIAANTAVPEVCVLFGSGLYRGCRSQKIDAEALDAFASPNYPRLARIGIDIEMRWELIRRPVTEDAPLSLAPVAQPVVAVLRLFPGITAELLRNVLRPPLQGLVLEAYGVGNGPDAAPGFLDALAEAAARGVVIVDCTQCWRGSVDLNDYASGASMAGAGVISGYDMTTEAALAKMFVLFGRGLPVDEVKRLMETDLKGELSRYPQVPPPSPPR